MRAGMIKSEINQDQSDLLILARLVTTLPGHILDSNITALSGGFFATLMSSGSSRRVEYQASVGSTGTICSDPR